MPAISLRNRSNHRYLPLVLLALLAPALNACELPPEEDGAATAEAKASALNLGTINYDGPGRPTYTTCNGMHCCPAGQVMLGAHLSKNVFACAPVALAGANGEEYVDGGSTFNARLGMHTCAPGFVMAGLNVSANKFTCRKPANPALNMASEYVDFGTQRNTAAVGLMHACAFEGLENPNNYAMTGIHVTYNWFTCAR